MQAAMARCMPPCLACRLASSRTLLPAAPTNPTASTAYTHPNNLLTHTHTPKQALDTLTHLNTLFTRNQSLHIHPETTSPHPHKQHPLTTKLHLDTHPSNLFTRTPTSSYRNNILTRTHPHAQSRDCVTVFDTLLNLWALERTTSTEWRENN
jgi:hypothetical protein